MEDEQLLEFDPKQAKQQLNDEQLERYNELKKQDLEENINEQKNKDAETAVNGLSEMRRSVEKELTVTVHGIEFKADIDAGQIKKLSSFAEHTDKTEEELNPEEAENITENILSVLSDLSINYSRSDWDNSFGDAGVITLATITMDLVQEIESFMQQKKTR